MHLLSGLAIFLGKVGFPLPSSRCFYGDISSVGVFRNPSFFFLIQGCRVRIIIPAKTRKLLISRAPTKAKSQELGRRNSVVHHALSFHRGTTCRWRGGQLGV